MDKIRIFENPNFGSVRIITEVFTNSGEKHVGGHSPFIFLSNF